MNTPIRTLLVTPHLGLIIKETVSTKRIISLAKPIIQSQVVIYTIQVKMLVNT